MPVKKWQPQSEKPVRPPKVMCLECKILISVPFSKTHLNTPNHLKAVKKNYWESVFMSD